MTPVVLALLGSLVPKREPTVLETMHQACAGEEQLGCSEAFQRALEP